MKVLILLAGYPGTGKSYFAKQLKMRHPDFIEIVQDTLKEQLWDQYGFHNLEEKTDLEKKAWKQFYALLNHHLQEDVPVLLDYPFSDKQKNRLKSLADTYDYQVLTLRFIADLDIVYERRVKRDLDPDRHLGHMVTHYQKGDICLDRHQTDAFITYEAFKKKCLESGYATFSLGTCIEQDMSDFSKVDIQALIEKVETFIKK